MIVGLSATPAWAADDGRQRAATLLDEGNQLFDQKRYADALHRFEDAYAAFASPKILLNLAEAQRELGALDRAADCYEQFLEESARTENAKFREYRELAQDRLAALAKRLGRIELGGDIDGAEVKVGEASVRGLRQGRFWILPGDYRLTVTKSGAEPFVKTLSVGAGEQLHVTVGYLQSPTTVAKTEPVGTDPTATVDETPAIDAEPQPSRLLAPAPAADTQAPITSQWWFWTGIGAVVLAGVVVGAVAASGGGDDFVPTGELGRESTSGWQPFAVGGLR